MQRSGIDTIKSFKTVFNRLPATVNALVICVAIDERGISVAIYRVHISKEKHVEDLSLQALTKDTK